MWLWLLLAYLLLAVCSQRSYKGMLIVSLLKMGKNTAIVQ